MKKVFSALLCAVMVLGITGCGGGKDEAPSKKEYIEESKLGDLYETPKDFKGKYVKLAGKVFSDPEEKDDFIIFQMWQDPKNNDHNTVVVVSKEMAGDIKNDDYVKIDGYVEDEFSGESMLGTSVTAPQIKAEKVEKVSYIDVMSPTLKSIEVNQTKKSHGVEVTLEKIEIAKDETRAYMTVNNKAKDDYTFYTFNTKIIQDSKQYKEETNFAAEYKKIESDISSGVKEEGIIVFKSIEQKNFKLICEGHSENYDLDTDSFTFEIKVK